MSLFIRSKTTLVCALLLAAQTAGAGSSAVEKLAASCFPDGAVLEERTRRLTDDERGALKTLGIRIRRREPQWYGVGGVGYLACWEMRGRHGPVELVVAADSELAVAGVMVVRHRERWGAGIVRKGFLKQFVGKTRSDRWRIGEDVDGITSATVSSRAVAEGTREVLVYLAVMTGEAGDSPE